MLLIAPTRNWNIEKRRIKSGAITFNRTYMELKRQNDTRTCQNELLLIAPTRNWNDKTTQEPVKLNSFNRTYKELKQRKYKIQNT